MHLQPYPSSPVLDVMIPHYRDPDGLAQSLESIAAQDWLDPAAATAQLRVIVLDDGSDPANLEQAKAHCARFRAQSGQALDLVHEERNRGRPYARNRLLDLAQAPYLAWLDAGDLWYPRKLSVQFAHLAAAEAAGHAPERLWVSCAYDWDQNGRRVPRQQAVTEDPLLALLTGESLRAYLWTLLGRAEAFAIAGRFDPELHRLQDLDYFMTFLRAGGEITVPADPEPLCCYVKSDIGRDARAVAASHARVMAKHAACIQFYPRDTRARMRQKGPVLAARFARANGAHMLALQYLAMAIMASPVRSLRLGSRQVVRRVRGAIRP